MKSKNEISYLINNNFDDYFNIAIDRFLIAENAYIRLMQQTNETANEETYDLYYQVRSNCIETICFSAMALEGFINAFSMECISKDFAENIDRLDVCAKFFVAISKCCNIELEKGKDPLQKISSVVKKRNSLVHNKTKRLKKNTDGSLDVPIVNIETDYMIPAYDSLTSIKLLTNWLKKHCPNVNLIFDTNKFDLEIKGEFKKHKNTWLFNQPITMIRKS